MSVMNFSLIKQQTTDDKMQNGRTQTITNSAAVQWTNCRHYRNWTAKRKGRVNFRLLQNWKFNGQQKELTMTKEQQKEPKEFNGEAHQEHRDGRFRLEMKGAMSMDLFRRTEPRQRRRRRWGRAVAFPPSSGRRICRSNTPMCPSPWTSWSLCFFRPALESAGHRSVLACPMNRNSQT